MNEQEVSIGTNRQFDCRERGVNRRSDARHLPAIFDLQAVGSAVVIFCVSGTQDAIAVCDDHF